MRALILVAGAALAVSACSSNESANEAMNVENLQTENLMENDMGMANDMTMMNETNMGTETNATMNATETNATETTNNAM